MGSEWPRYLFEDCMDAIIDYRGKTPRKTDSGIPLITAKIIKNGTIQPVTEYIAESNYDSWMRRGIPEAGDVVLTTEAPLGEVAQLDNRKIALAQRVITLRGKKGFLDNTFLRYLLLSNDVQHQLDGRGTGTTVKGIKQSELRKVELPIPAYGVQQKIAHILVTVDNKIQLNRQTNQTLEAMAQALFKSWFVDFDPVFDNAIAHNLAHNNAPLHNIPEPLLPHAQRRLNVHNVGRGSARQTAAHAFHHLFPQAFEQSDEPSVGIQGWIPKGWDLDGLGSFINFSNGKLMKSTVDGLYPLYGANGIIGKTNEIRCSNAIIIGRVGAYCGAIKYCPSSFWPSDNTIVASSTESEDMLPFILYQLKYLNLNQYAGGAAQPLLNQATLKSIKVSAPSRSACNVFNKTVSEFIIKSTNLENEIHVLESLRDTLLPKLISGELRIPDAEQATEALAK